MSEVLNISVSIGQDWSGDFAYDQASAGDALIMVFYNNNIPCTQIATENYSGDEGEFVISAGVKYTATLPLKKTFKLDESSVTYKLFILNLELQEATLLYSGGVAITPDPNADDPDIWDGQYPVTIKTVNSLPGVEYYKAGDQAYLLGDGYYFNNGNEWEKYGGGSSVAYSSLDTETKDYLNEGPTQNFTRYVSGDISGKILSGSGTLTWLEYLSYIKAIRVYGSSELYHHKIDAYYNNHSTYKFFFALSRKLKSGGSWTVVYSAVNKAITPNVNGITKVSYLPSDNDYYITYPNLRIEVEIDYRNVGQTNRATQTADDPLYILKDTCIVTEKQNNILNNFDSTGAANNFTSQYSPKGLLNYGALINKHIQADRLINKINYSVVYEASKSAKSTLPQNYVLTAVGDYIEFEYKPLTDIYGNYGIVGSATGSRFGSYSTGLQVKYDSGLAQTFNFVIQTGKWSLIKLLIVSNGIEAFVNGSSLGVKTEFVPLSNSFTIRTIGQCYSTDYANVELGSLKIHCASGDINVNNLTLIDGIESSNISLNIKQFEKDYINREILKTIGDNFSSYYNGTNSHSLLPTKYVLSADGDYLEFEVKISDWSSNKSLGIIGDIAQLKTTIGFYTSGAFYVRNSAGTWINSSSIGDTRGSFAKIKLLYASGNLEIYLDGILKYTRPTPGTLEINSIGAAYTLTQTTLMNFKNLVIHSAASGDLTLQNPVFDDTIYNWNVSVSNDGNGFLTPTQISLIESLQTDSLYNPQEIVVIKTNGLLKIFIKGSNPLSFSYIGVNLELKVDAPTNTNSWNFNTAAEYSRTGEFTFATSSNGRIVNSGEWETAIMVNGEADFMGGRAHGDEVLSIATLLIDGVQKDLTTIENFRCRELKFIQVSNLEKPSTSNPVCEHKKIYTINSEGIFLEQRYKWLTSEQLQYAYLTMLPIDRVNNTSVQITTKAFRDNDFVIDDVSAEGFTGGVNDQTPNDVKKMNIWGDASGIAAEVTIIEVSDELPNAKYYISNATAYNKFYFDFCGTHTTSINEVWKIKSHYKITSRN